MSKCIIIIILFVFIANTPSEVLANAPNPYEIEGLRLRHIPSFKLNTFNHEEVSHHSLIGEDTIITFWATWSPVSKEDLMRLYENSRGKDIKVLAICIDKYMGRCESFIHKLNTEGIIMAYDKDGEISKKVFKVFMVPTSIFVNKRGIIEEIYLGLQKWRERL